MPAKVVTPLGKFNKGADGHWACSIDVSSTQIRVVVSDVNGRPDFAFVERVPDIVRNLPMLELLARDSPKNVGSRLEREHRVVGIFSPGTFGSSRMAYDFSLQFHYLLAGRWDEITFVTFKDNKAVSWCRLD